MNSMSVERHTTIKAILFAFLYVSLVHEVRGQVGGTPQPDLWPSPDGHSQLTNRDTVSLTGQFGVLDYYTGQHSESFPLLTMSGRGGVSIDLSLRYIGSVARMARAQNHESQASPFGLGFDLVTSINFQYIQVDHNNTAIIDDDHYSLCGPGLAIKMRRRTTGTGDFWVLENGSTWLIERHIELLTEENLRVVTGFTIRNELGQILKFGDQDTNYDQRNATQYLIRYGDVIQPNATCDDAIHGCAEPYAHQWYLKSVSDAGALNFLTFDWVRDDSPDGWYRKSAPSTLLHVPRFTYLSSITSSDGQSMVFSYVARNDYQVYFSSPGVVNFGALQRIDKIEQKAADGTLIRKVCFNFEYLTRNFGIYYLSEFNKLLLAAMQTVAGDNSDSLPPTRFEYYQDSLSFCLGSVHRIIYPSGLIKEISYRQLENDSNFTELSLRVDSLEYDPNQRLRLGNGENMLVYSNSYSNVSHPLSGVVHWDSYWKRNTDLPTGAVYQYLPTSWSSDWIPVCDPSQQKIFVYRWKGGYWKVDTIPEVDPAHPNLSLHADNDGFLAVAKDPTFGAECNYGLWYYRWDGNSWSGLSAVAPTPVSFVQSLKCSNGTFAVSYSPFQSGGYHFTIGQYDPSIDQVNSMLLTLGGLVTEEQYAIGPGVVALFTGSMFRVFRYNYNSHQWQQVYSFQLPYVWEVLYLPKGVAIFSGGISFGYWNWPVPLPQNSYLNTLLFTHKFDSLEVLSQVVIHSDWFNKLRCSYHQLATDNGWYEWNGHSWGTFYSGPNFTEPFVTVHPEEFAILGTPPGAVGWEQKFKAYSYQGEGGWHNLGQYSLGSSASSGGLHILDKNIREQGATQGRAIYADDPYLKGFGGGLDSVGEIGNQYAGAYNSQSIVGTTATVVSSDAHVDWADPEIDVYKYVNRKYRGKVPLVAVDSIILYQSYFDHNPIVQSVQYYAGLVDPHSLTPRFGKVTVSSPHYRNQTDTIAFRQYHYFNDIDSTSFYNPSVYDGSYFPPLSSANRYGIANGGYRLDGRSYLTCSYVRINATPPTIIWSRDSVRTFYSLKPTRDTLYDLYSIQADSVTYQIDGVSSKTRYYYDRLNGLVTSTRGVVGPDRMRIDSTVYAYYSNSSMLSDNAVIQPSDHFTIDRTISTGQNVVLDHDATSYQKKGSWQQYQSTKYLLNPVATIATQTITAWDAIGNIIQSRNALDVPAASVWDKDAVRVIASASNASPQDLLVQDFEQGTSWQSWTFPSSVQGYFDATSPFSGTKAFKIVDVAGSNPNWGPYREILRDSLTTKSYYFSAWVKTNHSVKLYCWCKDAVGADCPSSPKVLTFTGLPSGQWTQIQGTIDLSNVWTCVQKIRVQLVLDDGSSDRFAVFDDVRFHSSSALVRSTVFHPALGIVTSSAGENNAPTKYVYDGLSRPTLMTDHLGNTLKTKSYFNCADSISPYQVWISSAQHKQSHFDSVTVSVNGTCQAHIVGVSHGDPELAILFIKFVKNSDTVYKHAALPGEPVDITVLVPVQIGDKLKFIAKVGGLAAADSCSARLVTLCRPVSAPIEPTTPSYTRTTSYLNSNDSLETVTFEDKIGEVVQRRSFHSILGADTLIRVDAQLYDARGRVWRNYKPYLESGLPRSLLRFADSSSVRQQTDQYYDTDGPGPNCVGYPFTEIAYETAESGRLRKVLYPGSFRSYPTSTDFLSSQGAIGGFDANYFAADSLFRHRKLNENGIVSVEYRDKLDRIVAACTDSASGGLNVYTRCYQNFNDNDTLIVQPEGQQLRFVYNNNEWLLYDSTGDRGSTSYVYNMLGLLRFKITDSDDPNDRFQYIKYDRHNRPIEKGIFPFEVLATFEHANDPDYPRSSESGFSPVVLEEFHYDQGSYARGQLSKSITHPSGKNGIEYSYDSLEYDSCGRVSRKIQTSYKLDNANNNRKIMSADYDRQGNITSLTFPNLQTIVYMYDKAGRVSSVTDIEASPYATFVYWPIGKVRTKTLYNGMSPIQTVDYKYNARDWLTDINDINSVSTQNTGSADHYGLRLAYGTEGGDPFGYYNGNVRRYTTKVSPTGTYWSTIQKYQYDHLDRITQDSCTAGYPIYPAAYFWYDKNGNIDYVQKSGTTYDYQYYAGTNRVRRVTNLFPGTDNFKYTGAGSIDSITNYPMRIEYDEFERMKHRTRPGPINTTDETRYWYNAEDMRIGLMYNYNTLVSCNDTIVPIDMMMQTNEESMTSGPIGNCTQLTTTATGYYYFGDNLISEYSGGLYSGGTLTANYIYANGERVGRLSGATGTRFYLGDHLGSTLCIIDGSGTVQNRAFYRPFGEVYNEELSTSDSYKYTSQRRDQELATQWDYFGARYYIPNLKLFSQVDPSWNKLTSWGPYVYGLNCPNAIVDKNGGVPTRVEFGNATTAGLLVQEAFISGVNLNQFYDGSRDRYVGLERGIVDLKHFSRAFALTRWWMTTPFTGSIASGTAISLGVGVETYQTFKRAIGILFGVRLDDSRSAMSPEDLPSNRMGVEFAKIFDPSKPLSQQVTEFFTKLGAMTEEEFKEKYPELWNALPENVASVTKIKGSNDADERSRQNAIDWARQALDRQKREQGRSSNLSD